MVEGAALEMLYRGNSIVGSNPTLSAIFLCLENKGVPLSGTQRGMLLGHAIGFDKAPASSFFGGRDLFPG